MTDKMTDILSPLGLDAPAVVDDCRYMPETNAREALPASDSAHDDATLPLSPLTSEGLVDARADAWDDLAAWALTLAKGYPAGFCRQKIAEAAAQHEYAIEAQRARS